MEFEEYCGVYLAKLALGGPKPTFDYESRRLGRKNGWTITEQLTASVQLPVNLKANFES